jgi:hypothetical protein
MCEQYIGIPYRIWCTQIVTSNYGIIYYDSKHGLISRSKKSYYFDAQNICLLHSPSFEKGDPLLYSNSIGVYYSMYSMWELIIFLMWLSNSEILNLDL